MGAPGEPLSERVVLVVDDEPAIRHLTARMLADAGLRVLEAHSGSEALALLAMDKGTIQLVLTDIRMPEMSGIELAEVMGREYPAIPILLMSGQGVPTADYPGAFLPKPFKLEQLCRAVGAFVPLPQAGV